MCKFHSAKVLYRVSPDPTFFMGEQRETIADKALIHCTRGVARKF